MSILVEVVNFVIYVIELVLILNVYFGIKCKEGIQKYMYIIVAASLYALIYNYIPNYVMIPYYFTIIALIGLILKNFNISFLFLGISSKALFDAINLEFMICITGKTGNEIHSCKTLYLIYSMILLVCLIISLLFKKLGIFRIDASLLSRATIWFFAIGVIALGVMITVVQLLGLETANARVLRMGAFILGIGGISVFSAMAGAVFFYQKNDQLKCEMRIREEMNAQLKHYYMELLEKEEMTKKFRHDIRAHISILKEYISREEYSGLKEYIAEMDNAIVQMKRDVQTGNHVINAVVSDVISQYPSVKVIWQGRISDQLNIKMIDLCIIISNLLKNACREAESQSDNTVIVRLKNCEPAIIIEVENYTDKKVHINGNKVIKRHEYGHGYGLMNVSDSVKKYDGYLELTCENNRFIASIVLPNATK